MKKTSDYGAYLFDLDGTVYLGSELIPGADEAIASLRGAGRKVMFLSNKPIATRREYADKLTELGIPTSEAHVLNSSLALATHLQREMPAAAAYCIAETPVLEDLIAAGIRIVNEPLAADVVVASWDRDFSYRKLDGALQAILNGAALVASNPDVACPMPRGALVPDCGAILAAIEACAGKRADAIAGKPSPIMGELALAALGVEAGECLMVGDRLETDIAFGHACGMGTALVRSGADPAVSAVDAPVVPDYIIESVAELSLVSAAPIADRMQSNN